MVFVWIISGTILGLILGYLIAQSRSQKELTFLRVENAKLQNLDEVKSAVLSDFTNIANQALIENQKKLDEQSKSAIEDKLKPLTEAISRYQKQVDEFSKETIKDTAALKNEVVNLAKNSQMINDETQKLTKALTTNQNIKGSYGESTLEVVLQAAGMAQDVHYIKQFPTFSINEQGENKRVYPDYVINLPEDRHIVVDSKANFENFIKYQNEEDKEEKERRLKDFKADIKKTVKNLSEKNYQEAQGLSSPDFVLMYIPLEASLALLYQDDDILNFAAAKNIVLVGTASLIATVKLVKSILAQEKQRESYLEIAKCGTLLHGKFVDFCGNLEGLQKKFDAVSGEFKTTLGRFTRGNDSMFKTVKKLEELGISSGKEIPQALLEDFEEPCHEQEELPQIQVGIEL